jgi:hypothetical protein
MLGSQDATLDGNDKPKIIRSQQYTSALHSFRLQLLHEPENNTTHPIAHLLSRPSSHCRLYGVLSTSSELFTKAKKLTWHRGQSIGFRSCTKYCNSMLLYLLTSQLLTCMVTAPLHHFRNYLYFTSQLFLTGTRSLSLVDDFASSARN